MKNIYIILTCFLFPILGFSQEKITFREYSYAEFFKMIEEEPSDTFTLKNAVIVFDSITDTKYSAIFYRNGDKNKLLRQDVIELDKELDFENILFINDYLYDERFFERNYFKGGLLYNIQFNKKTQFKNCLASFENCVFQDEVRIRFNTSINEIYDKLNYRIIIDHFGVKKSTFKKGIIFGSNSTEKAENTRIQVGISDCEFWPLENRSGNRFGYMFSINNLRNFYIEKSIFHGHQQIQLYNSGGEGLSIESNDFKNNSLDVSLSREREQQRLDFSSNIINQPTKLRLGYLKAENNIGFKQFKRGIYQPDAIYNYVETTYYKKYGENYVLQVKDSVQNDYMVNGRHSLAFAFKEETKLLGKLKSHYNSQHDKEFENAVFMEIKDLETRRLKYLYQENPSFNRYFKWKVNQFLKVFSAYGTEPSRAVTFSFYVILFFAFIYLFFPNHWDSHGKNRIMDRFQFFVKYMDQKSGMHEVYLKEQLNDLMVYEDFKSLLIKKGNRIPKFFVTAGLPLYKWAVSGTKLSASLLKRVDIMQGTWQELPTQKRFWKSILLVSAFLIAVVYDILIKMLNALMLSINTFTTLGFGEIPIKGLPRYLAIIQGFIGWFMLTIFSVSLISQLLN